MFIYIHICIHTFICRPCLFISKHISYVTTVIYIHTHIVLFWFRGWICWAFFQAGLKSAGAAFVKRRLFPVEKRSELISVAVWSYRLLEGAVGLQVGWICNDSQWYIFYIYTIYFIYILYILYIYYVILYIYIYYIYIIYIIYVIHIYIYMYIIYII